MNTDLRWVVLVARRSPGGQHSERDAYSQVVVSACLLAGVVLAHWLALLVYGKWRWLR